ncbi:MAG: DUF4159 domain-containing protein [Gemmatimonadales bacterium]|nr:MAG: DUF4159 domain-containing protein [Gemmatimonadales bacterium]
MRILVSTALMLAAVSLAGMSVVGPTTHSLEWWSEVREGDPSTGTGGALYRLAALVLPLAVPLGGQELPPSPDLDPRALLLESRGEGGGPGSHWEFYFTRAIYSEYQGGWGWGRRARWATDYPKADHQFLVVLKRLIAIDAYGGENAVRLDDPEIRRFPFLYALEVSRMNLTDAEVQGLRDYLEAGGFLVIDDFWGERALQNLAYQLNRVLPGRLIRPVAMDHPIFSTVYALEEIQQVPNVGNGRRGGPTTECWGCEPMVFGISDDRDRLMVVINWNTDLGDAWEWAEDPWYPLQYSTFAYKMGVNMVAYAMSH